MYRFLSHFMVVKNKIGKEKREARKKGRKRGEGETGKDRQKKILKKKNWFALECLLYFSYIL